MEENETPLTDAQCKHVTMVDGKTLICESYFVPTEFARMLERKLRKAELEIEKLRAL